MYIVPQRIGNKSYTTNHVFKNMVEDAVEERNEPRAADPFVISVIEVRHMVFKMKSF